MLPGGAADVGASGVNVRNGEDSTACGIENLCALFQSVVNIINADVAHREEEARGLHGLAEAREQEAV